MNKYIVTCTGTWDIEIDAENEEEASSLAEELSYYYPDGMSVSLIEEEN